MAQTIVRNRAFPCKRLLHSWLLLQEGCFIDLSSRTSTYTGAQLALQYRGRLRLLNDVVLIIDVDRVFESPFGVQLVSRRSLVLDGRLPHLLGDRD